MMSVDVLSADLPRRMPFESSEVTTGEAGASKFRIWEGLKNGLDAMLRNVDFNYFFLWGALGEALGDLNERWEA